MRGSERTEISGRPHIYTLHSGDRRAASPASISVIEDPLADAFPLRDPIQDFFKEYPDIVKPQRRRVSFRGNGNSRKMDTQGDGLPRSVRLARTVKRFSAPFEPDF